MTWPSSRQWCGPLFLVVGLGGCADNSLPSCQTDRDCVAGRCIENRCGECSGNGDCNASYRCQELLCIARSACSAVKQCRQGICVDRLCMDCLVPSDCGETETCQNNICADPCENDKECASRRRQCIGGRTGVTCGECIAGSHNEEGVCVANQKCTSSFCNGHGACGESGGTAVCTCEPGFGGKACEGCREGYHDFGDGACKAWDLSGSFTKADFPVFIDALEVFGKEVRAGDVVYAFLDGTEDDTSTQSTRTCLDATTPRFDAWDIERKRVDANTYRIRVVGQSDADCPRCETGNGSCKDGQPDCMGEIRIGSASAWKITEEVTCSISGDTLGSAGILIPTYCAIDKEAGVVSWRSGSGCARCCLCGDGAGVDIGFIVSRGGGGG